MAKGRTRKFSKLDDLLVLTGVGALAYVVYPPRANLVGWMIVPFAVLLIWVNFVMPTHCDYRTQRGKPCDRRVRGKLRGCRDHARWKRDAMFTALGGQNPGRRLRASWVAPGMDQPNQPRGHDVRAGRPVPPLNVRGMYDLSMLALTLLSTVAAVAALFL